jgi:hypothetical protein
MICPAPETNGPRTDFVCIQILPGQKANVVYLAPCCIQWFCNSKWMCLGGRWPLLSRLSLRESSVNGANFRGAKGDNRSETQGFSRDDIGLEPGFEKTRQEILEQVQRREIAPDRKVPNELINTPYTAAKSIGLFVEDGVVVL